MIRAAALLLLATPALAETVVPARPIPARALIVAEDLALLPEATPGALSDPAQALGLEARVALYPGRPVRPQDLVAPALVERNALLPLVYARGALWIATEGRALDRGAAGDLIRVMNLASRATVTARVGPDGSAFVSE